MKRVFVFSLAGVFILFMVIALVSMKETPSSAELRMQKGRSLLDAENYLGVLEKLRSLPDNQHQKGDAHTLLGTAYLRLHLYLAAIKEFEGAEKQDSRRADPWIGMASSYIEFGDDQKALDKASHATTIDPKSANAWIMLGRAYWLQHNFIKAEEAALKAQKLEPDLPVTAELLLHIYFDDEQPEKFETAFDRLKNPTRSAQDLAVRFYVRQGSWLKAYENKVRFDRTNIQRSILETELALKREPNRMALYPGLIRNLVKDGRYRAAIDAAHSYKGPVSMELEIGKAYWMLGQRDPAIQAFERASVGRVHKLSAEVALAVLTGDLRHWREAYQAERIENDYFILARLESALAAAPPVYRAFAYRYAGVYDSYFYNKTAEQALKVLE